MTTLVVFTNLSKLMLAVAVREIRRMADDVIAVDLSDDMHRVLKEARISSFPIRANGYKSWEDRDIDFKKHFMPGAQLDFPIPTTDMAIWKMASLDRWSFWYRGKVTKTEYDRLMAIRWDKAIVPSDMGNPLPWTLARYSGKPVTAVKVSSFRTREWYDSLNAKVVPFDAIITDNPADMDFLKANGFQGKIEVYG